MGYGPAGGLGGTSDPALEIGNLIAQLQASAREAREQLTYIERERDEYRSQLGEATARLHDATARLHEMARREEETRARFVEVTSVIRERDELNESVESHQKSIAELQRRHDAQLAKEMDLQRQRGALILDRDRAMQERDAATRERDELRGKVAEAQKQVVSLRQARDAAQRQAHDLTDKVGSLEDEIAEISHDRDTALKKSGDTATHQRRLDEVVAERDQIAARLEKMAAELQAREEHGSELLHAHEAVLKVTVERDELRAELEKLRAEPAKGEVDSAEREALNNRIQALVSVCDELQAQLAARDKREAEKAADPGGAQKKHEEALVSLAAAQKQIDHIIRDRDQVRQQGIDRALEMENDVNSAKEAMTAMEKKLAASQNELFVALEKAQNFDQQRLAAIDIAAQLDAAKREIKKLTADLAEARLEVKASQSRVPAAKTPPPLPPKVVATAAAKGAAPATPAAVVPAPAAELDEEVLTEKEARGLLSEIKRCYTTFTKTPTDFSLLNELHCQLQHFSERARVSGFLGLHRISHAFHNLAQDLYKYPEQVNPSTLRTVSQTIDLLGTLLKQKNYAALKDPARSLVFAVDDDADNCDSIRMAMECVAMRTRCAQEPAVALAEISSDDYNLIFLDVALPHMDGFELCQHIRALPNHAHTPIVFLTGLTSIENRVQSSLSGGNDFVGKPFNLHELGLKAISLVLKASLHME